MQMILNKQIENGDIRPAGRQSSGNPIINIDGIETMDESMQSFSFNRSHNQKTEFIFRNFQIYLNPETSQEVEQWHSKKLH